MNSSSTEQHGILVKPVVLHGHTRPITRVRYNTEGNLLFSCAKNNEPGVWYSENGERLGTFRGHKGAVWCLDVAWDTSRLLTGSGDNTVKIWDCQTGTIINELKTMTAVRTCGFSFSGNLIMYSTDKAMGHPSELLIFDTRDQNQITANKVVCRHVLSGKEKITASVWGHLDSTVITGQSNGAVATFDVMTGGCIKECQIHDGVITDMQVSSDNTMLLTASKDCSAKLLDRETLQCKKTYTMEIPVNGAALCPVKPHVLLGGGKDAMGIAMTSSRSIYFDAYLYHLVYEKQFGRVKGHFGPINTVAFHPKGTQFCTGGEDGLIHLNKLPNNFVTMDIMEP